LQWADTKQLINALFNWFSVAPPPLPRQEDGSILLQARAGTVKAQVVSKFIAL